MKVQTLREHRDQADRIRHPNEFYDCEPERADDLHRNGYVVNLDRVGDGGWLEPGGRILSPWPVESMLSTASIVPTGIRSLQLCEYDPGNAAYRYHGAANSAPGGTSAFVRYGHSSPYCDLRQYDGQSQEGMVSKLFDEAHAVHVHMTYDMLEKGAYRWPKSGKQLLVRHYHGSDQIQADQHPKFIENQIDADLGAVQVGARLYHNRYSPRMQWLPIPMPVADYQELRRKHFIPRADRPGKRLRLCHSPTHWRLKGTVALQTVVADLDMQGVGIDLVMIQNMKHGEALAVKASCDATFDSFWLGIQGAGLEAAAMGQCVMAGDPEVWNDYAKFLGMTETPYTFTRGSEELKAMLLRLANEPEWCELEGQRVKRYVDEFHDYPMVGARYWDIIRSAMAERGLNASV